MPPIQTGILDYNRSPRVATYSSLIDVIQGHGLEQIVNQPTHLQNILDLFLLNPNEKYTVNILPSLGDHDIVCVDIQVQPEIIKQKPGEIYLYDRANWDLIQQEMANLPTLVLYYFQHEDCKQTVDDHEIQEYCFKQHGVAHTIQVLKDTSWLTVGNLTYSKTNKEMEQFISPI